MSRRVVAVGAVIVDDAGRILLVLRKNEPQAGYWSLPGGKVEPGETAVDAVVREVAEETGLQIDVLERAWVVEIPYRGGTGTDDIVFEVHDFRAGVRSGTLRAGDDAADAAWFAPAELTSIPVTARLLDFLTAAGVLDRRPPPD
ncbi:NUDIX hydrolase [Gordonia bronchialis DSM 43247]|uniref:NUDIX hydrolase n=1 Tax=Gordonia bronchialis (strain ATCC 25592 / DSM 43247 / BCRC 13721 / JCM 3198 / KCTC 3076 / NBRC 16047 / NCTC 10667) TaxID=526226 RepID=D0L677_GORB4|nr:NUDIX domain-containing protein [Gordonia bronchialis]ACY20634.1 NUDIX hydrolase [Gordonia bronchialis DSM 43247]MCC3323411.1 NUDIX domain-containing protein [Gordonia bronchialis]QGS25603.1 NUDIX domain-containing protein [Gordonia bronchialis]UAK37992.1 NUDIX domain-containing protein [Gordonia bronchialis]STQ63462.1 CTP pyrophosphohydrolase [Gordonia bronchialis]